MLGYLLISAMILAVVSGGIGKPMKFKAPNEEDTHSVFLPVEVKCDGCLAIAYQVGGYRRSIIVSLISDE